MDFGVDQGVFFDEGLEFWDNGSPFEQSQGPLQDFTAPLQSAIDQDSGWTISQDVLSYGQEISSRQPETPLWNNQDAYSPSPQSNNFSALTLDIVNQASVFPDVNSGRQLPRQRSRYRRSNLSGLRRSTLDSDVYPDYGPNLSDPLEKWRNSPPEQEPALMSAIELAVRKQNSQPQPDSRSCHQSRSNIRRSSARRASSTISGDSATSASSAQSCTSSHSARSGSSQGRSRGRSRAIKARGQNSFHNTGDKSRIFKCTFCCDSFKNKHDWTRHENSLHLSTETWRCAPHGGSVVLSHTNREHCAYCHLLDPDLEHLESHRHQVCQGAPTESRTFRRKDHLTQHLRHYHQLETIPPVDDWRINVLQVVSRCGFCDSKLPSWSERADHLAKHFKAGLTMSDWKGDHGFTPMVESQVLNALPPFLIGAESKAVVPFSATNKAAQDHKVQITSQILCREPSINTDVHEGAADSYSLKTSTTAAQLDAKAYTELLTLHLSRFAREKISQGLIPTDAMFQQEARKVLYDCEDEWNQTVADNDEWLAAFRAQTRLTFPKS